LQKALQKELGNVPIEKALKGDSTFKGKNEQILILKEQIKSLKSRIQHSDANPCANGMQKPDTVKRLDIEKLNAQLKTTQDELIVLRNKYDGIIARNKSFKVNKEYWKVGQKNSNLK
jgi:hypothetical protein